jgi:hypothetical protein
VKPPLGASINWSHPLARGLVSALLFNDGGTAVGHRLRDLVAPSRHVRCGSASQNDLSPRDGFRGRGLYQPSEAAGSTAQNPNYVDAVSIAAGSDFSDFIAFDLHSTEGSNPGWWRSAGGGGTTFHIMQGASSLRPWIRWNGTDILQPSSGAAPPATGYQTIGISVRSSVNVAAYINGTGAHTATHSTATPAFDINPIGFQSGEGERPVGVWQAFYVWTRALSQAEHIALYLDPYAMLARPRRVVARIPGGAAAYSLDAAPGAVSLAGIAAGLIADRVVAGDPGAVTLAGQVAGLIADRSLNAEPGTVATLGIAASLTADRMLAADPGAVTINGIAAAVLADRVIIAAPGAVTLAGILADLVYQPAGAYSLNAEPGGITITGAAAGLIADRLLAADPGAIVITGTSAQIGRDLALAASPGAVAVAGSAAGLLADRAIGASPGAVLLAGILAALTGPNDQPMVVIALDVRRASGDLSVSAGEGLFSVSAEDGTFSVWSG